MRTPPMSDEELDEVVRRSAEAYPDEVPLGAWLRMEDKLGEAAMQQQVQQRVRRQVGRLFVLELLLVALALLWWHNSPLSSAQKLPTSRSLLWATRTPAAGTETPWKTAAPATPSRQRQTAPVVPGLAAAKPQLTDVVSKELIGTAITPASVAARTRISEGVLAGAVRFTPDARQRKRLLITPEKAANGFRRAVAAGEESSPRKHLADGATRSAAALPSRAEPARTSAENDVSQALAPTATGVGTATTAPDTAPETQEPAEATPTLAAVLPATPSAGDSALAPLPATDQPVPTASTDSAARKEPRVRPAYRLLLGVVGAPELTAVHLNELTRPGTTVGAVVEYRFTPRLRVRSGLLRSVKLYSARGSDYKPPATYWTWRVPVDYIEADCRLLEIPLDLRYEVLQRPTYSLFASAGLTSLLMRNEEYTYKYDLNGQYTERTWSYARGGNHPFGILTLSVGYERPVSARLSAQAEPFLKLPLGGVGFGQVHLRSAGVSFALKYGLLRPQAAPTP